MSFIYLAKFQELGFPFAFKEIVFSAKTDNDAIKLYPSLYISKERMKELRKKINEKNIVLIHSNKDFREIKAKSFE